MNSVLFAMALLLAVTTALNLETYSFKQYVREYRKSYDSAEYIERQALFDTRLADIIAHNANPATSYTRGINHMSDWTEQEKQALLGYHKGIGHLNRASAPQYTAPHPDEETDRLAALPARVDWREQHVVTPVKNQGHCGSCWTFSAAESVESHWAIKTGHLQELSQQQLASCTDNPRHCGGTGGCEGGTAQVAFDGIVEKGGIATEWSYPYASWFGTDFSCNFNGSMDIAAKLEARSDLPSNEYLPMMETLANVGPVSISVDASVWHDYNSGVWSGCDMQNPDINHAVQAVGYGTDPVGGDYWLVRNSWGTGWGEEGYIRVARNTGLCGTDRNPQDGSGCDGGPSSVYVCGMCGILYDNTYPIVNTKL